MRKLILMLIILTSVTISVKAQVKAKDLLQKRTNLYFINYYFEEEPDKIISSRASRRVINGDSSFCIEDYDLKDISKITYSSCFDFNGTPTHYGTEKEITKVFKDSIRLNFKGRDTTFLIDSEKELRNQTNLWFWKYMPYVNETVIVGGIMKNFITNKIDKVNISYTYLGKVKLKILGKTENLHLVKSFPLNGSEGVYDERWYDNKGMLVKEKHVVGTNGVRIGELSKIVK